jgi:hypothetical protein
MPRTVVGFLQNAWSPVYAGGTWPRPSWLRALELSRSGQRLRVLEQAARGGVGPALDFWWDNTTPLVGAEPSSVLPPDLVHMGLVLVEQCPDTVLLFGRLAADAFASISWKSPPPAIIVVPHPAYRVVTNALYERAGELVARGFRGYIRLRQGRGVVEQVGA